MATQTDDARRLTTDDAPAWVRADRACQHAWAHDKAWRRYARQADPPCHHVKDDPYSTGDTLLVQARRDYARQRAHRAPPAPHRLHAQDCNCPPCRKRKGEKSLPTPRQQRADRESLDVAGDDWRLSDEPRALHMNTMDVVFESAGRSMTRSGKMNWCTLRERFIDHLDQQAHHALLSLAEAEPRQARIVICCALLRLRQADVAQQEGLTQPRINQLLKDGLAFMRSAVVSDDGSSVALAHGRDGL